MITHLKGTLEEIDASSAVIDVNGLGYYVNIPMSTYDRMPKLGAAVKLFTHFVVRDDEHILFGFSSSQERELFRLLISVSSVGPKTAANALSSLSIDQLCDAIANSDVKIVSKISGIGKKTAERIIIELRDKVGKLFGVTVTTQAGAAASSEALVVKDAAMALEALGYRSDQVRKVAKQIHEELGAKATSEAIIKEALSKLNQ